ncbi:M23 family metallopeptidase [Jatrophihabitans cynanchi]|uniref:M23 family metallopeptidase n=1 Tax=Jatrophihabitans cynanchi TaxID=2944128 RepID=A0ABY7K064_9ACTN|nr:M23 family metallopeptidase [Jatrophihabitans sp. SB3-54]WAX57575.1 M23 family metallopeptidase [Jatrophihabitans sp. SB3-54]
MIRSQLVAATIAAPVAATLLLVLPGASAARPGVHRHARAAGSPAAVSYAPPVAPLQVVRGFVPPSTQWGPGHRGVDLATSPGEPVRAAGAGTVSFAGRVAGRGVVVIAHAGGVRTEYEPVTPLVRAGATVLRGAAIGRVHGTHGGCAPGRCLHWGARRGDAYFDPLGLLRPLGPVRLLPWADSP